MIKLLFAILSFYQTPSDSLVSIKLSLVNQTANFSDDLEMTVKIKSKTNRKIIVPKHMGTGIIPDCFNFVCVQVQRKIGNSWIDVRPHGSVDDFSPENITDTLNFNDERESKLNLDLFSIPCYGKYRVRVACLFSIYNSDIINIASDWLYYNCKRKIYPDSKRINSKRADPSYPPLAQLFYFCHPMTFISMAGILGALLPAAAYIPQAYKTIKTKSAKDLSITTFSMLFAGTLMGFIYSSYIHDTPFMVTNGITAVLSGIICCLKIVFMRNER